MNVGDSVFDMPSGGHNKLTQEEVIARFRKAHGDKYGYELVNYKGTKINVDIECPIHGIFKQQPAHHWNGCGCWKCASASVRERSKVYGVGINDVDCKTRIPSYRTWKEMIGRCYAASRRPKHPSYQDCRVCDEWIYFSKFKECFDENYIDGYDLDKDILFKGNKIYSPKTCRFVPHEINSLLINCRRNRGVYPIGVSKNGNTFQAAMQTNKGRVLLGSFEYPEEAFKAYKTAKEAYIKEVATSYYNQGKICDEIYQSLMNWTIEITD